MTDRLRAMDALGVALGRLTDAVRTARVREADSDRAQRLGDPAAATATAARYALDLHERARHLA